MIFTQQYWDQVWKQRSRQLPERILFLKGSSDQPPLSSSPRVLAQLLPLNISPSLSLYRRFRSVPNFWRNEESLVRYGGLTEKLRNDATTLLYCFQKCFFLFFVNFKLYYSKLRDFATFGIITFAAKRLASNFLKTFMGHMSGNWLFNPSMIWRVFFEKKIDFFPFPHAKHILSLDIFLYLIILLIMHLLALKYYISE